MLLAQYKMHLYLWDLKQSPVVVGNWTITLLKYVYIYFFLSKGRIHAFSRI
jgi:hypothetical protein